MLGGPKELHADIGSLKRFRKLEQDSYLKNFPEFSRLSAIMKPKH
jgi:hypothetical protein